MRQFFLVILLVAAAFSGGAFVNGPGLQWVQTRALRSLGLNKVGEIASVDLKPLAGSTDEVDESGLIKPEREALIGPQARHPHRSATTRYRRIIG